MPLHGTVGQLLNRLIAAGIGQRPVIFVTHRYVAARPLCLLNSFVHIVVHWPCKLYSALSLQILIHFFASDWYSLCNGRSDALH